MNEGGFDELWEQIDSGRVQPESFYFPAPDLRETPLRAVPQNIIKGMRKAIVEFDLLEPGDRVLIGLSGGKDSTLMAYALSALTRHLPWPVELAAMHVDLGLGEELSKLPIEEDSAWRPSEKNRAESYLSLSRTAAEAGLSLLVQYIDLSSDILRNPGRSPCSRCSYWRRALIHNYARREGYNKVAFAHHYDDAVETFLMGLLYSGQLGTFMPKTWLDRTGVTVTRPMVYIRERDIIGAINKMGLSTSKSPCPLDGFTQRARTKALIRELCKENPLVFAHIASAMREGKRRYLWPEIMERKSLRQKNLEFWKPRGL